MSPWTRRQVSYLLSGGSPLTAEEREKMLDELHEDPSLGHRKKGKSPDVQSSRYDWRKRGRK